MDIVQMSADYQATKLLLVQGSGLAKDALHIYFGLALFLFVRLVWRWRFGWLMAWLAVLVLAVGGEWLDLRGEGLAGAIQPDSAHWHDIWNTMFWPTVLALIGRWLHPKPKPVAAAEPLADESAERGSE
ncbi:MAG: hypothetical protein HC788_15120 [Sphingopyxis sp.]|nr:hypothetical protein [Sphingopyxis sp.]